MMIISSAVALFITQVLNTRTHTCPRRCPQPPSSLADCQAVLEAVLGAPGVDLTARRDDGATLLHIAASNWGPAGGRDKVAALEALAPRLVAAALAAGVDVDAFCEIDGQQMTALHYAAEKRSPIGPFLLAHADPKQVWGNRWLLVVH